MINSLITRCVQSPSSRPFKLTIMAVKALSLKQRSLSDLVFVNLQIPSFISSSIKHGHIFCAANRASFHDGSQHPSKTINSSSDALLSAFASKAESGPLSNCPTKTDHTTMYVDKSSKILSSPVSCLSP